MKHLDKKYNNTSISWINGSQSGIIQLIHPKNWCVWWKKKECFTCETPGYIKLDENIQNIPNINILDQLFSITYNQITKRKYTNSKTGKQVENQIIHSIGKKEEEKVNPVLVWHSMRYNQSDWKIDCDTWMWIPANKFQLRVPWHQ